MTIVQVLEYDCPIQGYRVVPVASGGILAAWTRRLRAKGIAYTVDGTANKVCM